MFFLARKSDFFKEKGSILIINDIQPEAILLQDVTNRTKFQFPSLKRKKNLTKIIIHI